MGSGNSDINTYTSQRYNSLAGYAQDVLDIIHALELEEVIFVGHSVSSMIGALAAIQEPDHFASLVMVGPLPCYLNDPPEYVGGFDRLQQVIMDLLRNAVKFTGRGGEVLLYAEIESSWVNIHVKDTGEGIPSHKQSRSSNRLFKLGSQMPKRGTPILV